MNTSHLTHIDNAAVLIAWHGQEDIQAVRIDQEERLYVNGKHLPLPRNFHSPAQIVINACGAGMNAKQVERLFHKP